MHQLQRFLKAQNESIPCATYQQALAEVRNGHKRGHWIWYIFPQLRGLGASSRSYFYGIGSMEEANAYMRHEILGARLIEISEALLALPNNNPYLIFGSPDTTKVQSCMTLFSKTENAHPVFHKVLEKYYGGKEDEQTLLLLTKG
ncbi:MAG: DUF1810 domain-containing protein [Clostridia bacterium]|nr:DUF1810 domain-containing protein [Clostridia bacterium]